jgi:hypothetical protein
MHRLSGGVGGFPGPGTVHSTGGATFVGACEVAGVTCGASGAYFAVEMCVTNAYAGNVIDVVDSATGNTTGTRLQCASGVVSAVVSGSACTFVTGNACSPLATTCATACTWSTIYNQLGTANFKDLNNPATVSSRLTLTLALLNGKACLAGNGAQWAQISGVTPNPTLAQPFTTVAISRRTGGFTSTQSIVDDNATYNMGYRATTNTVGSLSGTITATATDNVFNSIMEINASGAGNAFMVVNGAAGSTGTLTGAWSGAQPYYVGSFGGASSFLTGEICELLITTNALNAAGYGNLNTNQRLANRWGGSF